MNSRESLKNVGSRKELVPGIGHDEETPQMP